MGGFHVNKTLFPILGACLLLVGFQNCSGVNFNGVDARLKAQAISGGDVLDDPGNLGDGSDVTDSEGSNFGINFDRVCSNSGYRSNDGVTALNSSSLTLKILSSKETVVCTYSDTAQIKERITNNQTLKIPNCSLDEDKSYYIQIFGDDNKSVLFRALYDRIRPKKKIETVEILVDENLKDVDQPLCDERHSPLVLDTRRNVKARGVRLSSPEDGILFDILGLRSTPAPHVKRRISWPKSKRYEFLVLPNDKGVVEGINEMFGDNTLGPDGDFSDNGFLALAKFDGRDADGKVKTHVADGVISKDDGVFDRLRLWQDRNRDGISQPDELRSLESAEVEVIDLVYDQNYEEMDRYGNMTKYKSVVTFSDGEHRLIFDVWFKDYGLH